MYAVASMPTGRRSLPFVPLFVLVAAALPAAAAGEVPADLVKQLQEEITTSSTATCPNAASYALERPDAAAGPTVVGIGVFFQDLVALNDADQTLDMDVYVLMRWR